MAKSSRAKESITIHLMGNAHLDPAWLWPWTEGYTETIGLTATALRGMEMFDDFTFIRSSAQSYAWLKENSPDLFAKVQQRVKEGRWDIVGGWWEQPDNNLPSAESFLRQGLYGQRYFQKEFGRTAKVGYCVDSFGHPAGLPALLRAVGMEAYVFMRPSQELRPDLKSYFNWVSPDGSSVIAIHIPNYGVWSKDLCPTLATAIELRLKGISDVPYMYGWGDHGGGPSIQDVRQIKAIEAGDDEAAIKHGADPEKLAHLRKVMAEAGVKRFKFGTYTDLLNRVRKHIPKMPTIRQPAQHYAQGTYTSISAIKRNNRRLESDLYSAEALVLAIRQMGLEKTLPDAKPELDQAWQSLLFNQFHDLGAGTCFITAMEDAVRHQEHGRHIAQRVTNRCAQKLFRQIDASKFEFSTFFFNPLPWPVTASLSLRWGPALFDEAGRPMPFQFIPAESHRGGNEGRSTTMATLPACGGLLIYNSRDVQASPAATEGTLQHDGPLADELLRMYDDVNLEALDATVAGQVKRFKDSKDAKLSNRGRSKSCWMENDHLRAEFDAQGRLMKVIHKATRVNLLKAPIEPVIIDDDRDAWAHAREDKMPLKFNKPLEPAKGQGGQFIEAGQMRCTVASNFRWRNSTIRIEWSLARNLPYMDATVECHWQDRHAMVKLAIPTALTSPTATTDTPLAPMTVERKGVEEPSQKWMDLTGSVRGKSIGLALANDAKYGCSFINSTMYLTVLRSAHMAHMNYSGGNPPDRASRYYQDQGVQYFKVRLIPHEGSWQSAQVQRRAMELNCPPVIIHGGMHDGPLLADFSIAEVEPANVLVLGIKPAEDARGATMIRLWESSGKASTAKVRLGNLTAKVPLAKFQLKTLLASQSKGKLKIVETDALEHPVKTPRK